ncbi:MAG TPA: M20/M25/M40 family metallo-hydrolase [Povalibacter sp.]|uniref:M20/M25/M40 family metallo-hydrolase n=1 Tax=Povalibacter sp. TaxID=1962978 RepID=UPI002CF355AF|nr:M20/M25/M40 family metallo-hydrolase [Povalibacter sp.]HMN43726.1 M20/M25/M40 family metallo-hydrolase [Povalibacter sp.]
MSFTNCSIAGIVAALTVSEHSYPVVVNNPDLVARTLPTLQRVAGKDRVVVTPLQTGAEDFAFYAQLVPSFFFYVGVTPPNTDVAKAATNHSPLFYIDEPALRVATRALLGVAVDYLQGE